MDDKPGFREVSLRMKHDEAKRLRERSRARSNPLKYRKSFVKESSTINPMMLSISSSNRDNDDIGDIEMVQNPLRKKQRFQRKRGRTLSVINNLKKDTSQQSAQFKKALNRTKRLKELENKTKLKRIGKPEDLQGLVLLLSSSLSSFITGQNIAIDGGWTI